MNGGCVFVVVVVVVVVVVTHFLRAPCFKTGYAGSAGFAGTKFVLVGKL